MSVYITTTSSNDTSIYGNGSVPFAFNVVNASDDNILIQGINIISTISGTGDISTISVNGTIPIFTSFTSSNVSGNIVANQTIVAYDTGSFVGTICAPNNPYTSDIFGSSEILVNPSVTYMVQTGSFPAYTGSNGIGNGFTTITSSEGVKITIRSEQVVGVNCSTPVSVWALDTNRRPISYSDFDAIVTTNATLIDGNQVVIPPDLDNGAVAATYYSSSNTDVATVVANGTFGAITGSVGNAQLTAGGGAVTFVGTGTVIISNAVSDTLTGSVEITVVDSLPLAISITPSQSNITSNTTLGAKAYVVKQNGKVEDITTSAVWTSSNTAAATVGSSTGVITAASLGSGLPRGTGLQNTTITATYLGIQGTATITVVAA